MSGPIAAWPAGSIGSGIILLDLLVAAVWGASDFLGGVAARKSSALLVVVIAHGLSMALLVMMAAAVHARIPNETTVIWALITGLSGGIAVIVFYRALAAGEMGMAAAIAGVLTALVPVVYSWITEGKPSPSQLLGFLVAAVAIFLISAGPSSQPDRRQLVLAIIAGLGFGVFLIASKFASRGALLWPLAISRVTSAALAAAVLLVLHLRRTPVPRITPGKAKPLHSVFLLAAAAGILEAAGNLLYMLATLAGRLDVAAVLSSLYPAGTILLAIWLLKERTTRQKTVGIVLALVAVAMISL